MKKLLFLVIMTMAIGVGISVAQEAQTIEFTDCFFPIPSDEIDGETIDCGVLYVPQDRNEPDGLMIEIAFAILRSPNPLPDPIIYFEGGPGGSAISGIDSWVDFEMRQTRDIILVDQRGTGYSYPRLYCEETELIDDSDTQAYNDAIVACRERFASEGVDIADYHTINNANDIADLMKALAYPEYNLFGISYGTRLALNVMRDFPDGIRSVIIDSVYPPVVDAYEEEVISAYGSFRRMFDDCVADSACNSAFPDLENRFYTRIDDLNASPVTLADGTELSGASLLEMMFQWFYDADIIPYLPLMVDELADGGYRVLEALNDGILPIYDEEDYDLDPITAFSEELYYILEETDDDTYYSLYDELYNWDMTADGLLDILYANLSEDDASYLEELLADVTDDQMELLYTVLNAEDVSDTQGVYDAYECYEEVPFNSVADQQALMQTVTIPPQYDSLAELEGLAESCALWQTATAPQIEDEAVVSDIPTLVYAGNYDPVTPPSWGQIAAETLSNSTYVEFKGLGHSAIDGGDCPLSIAMAFIDNPTEPLDLSCVDSMDVEFITEMPDLSGFEE